MRKAHFYPAAVFVSALLFCAAAHSADPPPTPESRAQFAAGVSFLEQGKYAEAYGKFKEAYALSPRWTALGNLGIAAAHLERDGEAIDAMVQYLQRGGTEITAKEARAVRSDVERLQKESASVTLEGVGTFWVIDTRVAGNDSVVNEYGPFDDRAELRVRAGQHEFKLDRTGIVAPPWQATLLAGDAASHTFEGGHEAKVVEDFVAAPTESPVDAARGSSHTAAYVLGGGGVIAGVAATLFLLEARHLQNDADDKFRRLCPAGASDTPGCENRTAGDANAANWRTASLVTGIGAAAALLTGTVLYLTDGSAQREEASLRPWVSPSGIGLSGTF